MASRYRVDQAILASQRHRITALDHYKQIVRRREALTARFAGRWMKAQLNLDPGYELNSSDDGSTEAIESRKVRATKVLERAEAKLAAVKHAERTADLDRRLAALADGDTGARLRASAADKRRGRAEPAPVAQDEGRPVESARLAVGLPSQSVRAEVTGAVSHLRADATDVERAEAENLAEQVLGDRAGPARTVLPIPLTEPARLTRNGHYVDTFSFTSIGVGRRSLLSQPCDHFVPTDWHK